MTDTIALIIYSLTAALSLGVAVFLWKYGRENGRNFLNIMSALFLLLFALVNVGLIDGVLLRYGLSNPIILIMTLYIWPIFAILLLISILYYFRQLLKYRPLPPAKEESDDRPGE